MALFNFFKKKKTGEKKPIKKEKKKVGPLPAKKEEIEPISPKARKKISESAHRVLDHPHITEKATELVEKNKYVFKVLPRANKFEIKKSISDLYGVDVVDVKIINIPRRQRRIGRHMGWRKGYKKAIVKIKKGQKIEILPR